MYQGSEHFRIQCLNQLKNLSVLVLNKQRVYIKNQMFMLILQSVHTFLNTKTCLFILFYCLQNVTNEETGGKLVSSRLLVKLQVILPPVELRGLCHLNLITLDVASSYNH